VSLEAVAVALPVTFALWAPVVAEAGSRAGVRRALAAGAAAVAMVALLVASLVVTARPPGVISPHFPAAAAAFVEREVLPHSDGPQGLRLFHHQNWGGYLHWRLGVPVFWDGRNDVFAPLVRAVTTTPFPVLVERYGIDSLLLSPREARDLAPLLRGREWALVHLDSRAAVFLRRDAWAREVTALEVVPRAAPPGR
jgi:hypothetical protein